MVTLGLDASTTTIGYGVVDDTTRQIVDLGFFDISKIKTDKDKTFAFIQFLSNKPWISNISRINIEAALSGFAGGFTSQQVIIRLARWNAVFCYIVEEHYKLPVNLCNATTMRKQLFGKARIKGMKPKVFVKTHMELLMNVTPWVIYNKLKNVDVRMADAYDGLVAAFYT